jgi:CBS domain containing-hemolysin-like protein
LNGLLNYINNNKTPRFGLRRNGVVERDPDMNKFLIKIGKTYKNRTAGKITAKANATGMKSWLDNNTWSNVLYVNKTINYYAFAVLVLTFFYMISPIRVCLKDRLQDSI